MVTTAPSMSRPTSIPLALLLALVALAVTALALLTVQLKSADTLNPASQVPAHLSDPLAPSRPGGSLYQQQVPAEAAADPWQGSVYEQQVPPAAQRTAGGWPGPHSAQGD